MTLPQPRAADYSLTGDSLRFHTYPRANIASTIGDPEQVVWSSIKNMAVRDVADSILKESHSVSNKRSRYTITKNLKVYIGQAFELYEAAQAAKANTAPLLYYYSFLHLAKALCEIHRPQFHKTPESYRHGISWRPSSNFAVNMHTQTVNLTRRGVWHVLYEATTQQPCRASNPCKLSIGNLFSVNPEVSIEYSRAYGRVPNLVVLLNPKVMANREKGEIWVNFSVARGNLRELRLSRPKLLAAITTAGNAYHEVQSSISDWLMFEFERPKTIPETHEGPLEVLVAPEISAMNLFTTLGAMGLDSLGLRYFVPIQARLPMQLPQLLVLYSLMFWLGSIVRYDPHSLARLQEQEYWILIDGFMNQSRRWLLELFEWELYQCETTLQSVR